MKKFFYSALVLFMAVSCTGKSDSKDSQLSGSDSIIKEDSVESSSDSSALVDTNQLAVSTPQEESDNENKSEYGALVSEFEAAVKKYESNAKKGNWSAFETWGRKSSQLEEKIQKVKGKLTSSELKRFNKARKKWGAVADGYQ